MTALMVKMGSGFYIPKLDGFDDIQKETIAVNIDLAEEEQENLSYKELKGIVIMERYLDKLNNQIEPSTAVNEAQINFRNKHKINITLDEYLGEK